MSGDPAHQVARIHGAGLAGDFPAVAKNDQGRNAADAETGGDVLRFLGIQLGEAIAGFELVGRLGEGRRHHAAGAAPGRPEIDDDGYVATSDLAVECVGPEFDGMPGEQGLPAFSANRVLGQTIGRNAVGGVAVRADDQERGGHVQGSLNGSIVQIRAGRRNSSRIKGLKFLRLFADKSLCRLCLEREVKKSTPIYGVTRVDNETSRTHGWLVTVQRRGVIFRRQFSDGVLGGKARSLAAAKAYRDEIVAKHPPLSRREHAEIVKKSNKSGVVGVCRYCASESGRRPNAEERWFWVASWVLPDGRAKRVKFSVRKYGEEGAFKLAAKARREAVRQMAGNFDPGATRRKKRLSRA